MNWLGGKLLPLRIKTWLYWKIAFPTPPGRAIRGRLARWGEQKALRQSQSRLPSYQYQTLRGPNHIRLLKIGPPRSTNIFCPPIIHCSMEEMPLGSAPPYCALSYTWKEDELILKWARMGRHMANPIARLYSPTWWKAFVGDSPPRFPWLEKAAARLAAVTVGAAFDPDAQANLPQRLIICDGRAIMVTQNLHNALNAVAQLYSGYLWVDQLCINQDDIRERNAQVALMGQLYRNASQVVVWLGERTRLEAKAAVALEMIAAMSDDVEGILIRSVSLFGREMPKLFGLAGFFSRSWFDRLWIVQEFAVARQATFLLGDVEISLDTATCAMRRIEQVLSASSFAITADFSAAARSGLLDSREYTTANGQWSLEKWLSVARGRKTTDARDYVYGGLSLLGREGDQPVPDISTEPVVVMRNDTTTLGTEYSKPVEAVYFAFSVALFSSDLGLNALSLVGINRDLKDFPSWMVNLHHPLSPKPLHHLKMRRPRVLPADRPSHSPGIITRITGEIAELDAAYFDTIQSVGEPLEHWFNGLDSRTSGFHLTETLRLCLSLGPRYKHTGELSLVALWRTLILEANSDDLPSLDASFSDALRWYLDLNRNKKRPVPRNIEYQHDAGSENATLKGRLIEESSQTKYTSQSPQDVQSAHAHTCLKIALRAMVSLPEFKNTPFARALLPSSTPPNAGNTITSNSEKNLNDPKLWYESWLAFLEPFHETAPGRRLFLTSRGYIGMAPAEAQPGDEIMFMRGAWAPYVFRGVDMSKVEGWDRARRTFTLVGEGYLHGVMDGMGTASMGENWEGIWLILSPRIYLFILKLDVLGLEVVKGLDKLTGHYAKCVIKS